MGIASEFSNWDYDSTYYTAARPTAVSARIAMIELNQQHTPEPGDAGVIEKSPGSELRTWSLLVKFGLPQKKTPPACFSRGGMTKNSRRAEVDQS
jgi:hypothetical protein